MSSLGEPPVFIELSNLHARTISNIMHVPFLLVACSPFRTLVPAFHVQFNTFSFLHQLEFKRGRYVSPTRKVFSRFFVNVYCMQRALELNSFTMPNISLNVSSENVLVHDGFLNSHNLTAWQCIGIVRRNKILKTLSKVMITITQKRNFNNFIPLGKCFILFKCSYSVKESFTTSVSSYQEPGSSNFLFENQHKVVPQPAVLKIRYTCLTSLRV